MVRVQSLAGGSAGAQAALTSPEVKGSLSVSPSVHVFSQLAEMERREIKI